MSISLTIPWTDTELLAEPLPVPKVDVSVWQDVAIIYECIDDVAPDMTSATRSWELRMTAGSPGGDVALIITDQERFVVDGTTITIQLLAEETNIAIGLYYIELRDRFTGNNHVLARRYVYIQNSPFGGTFDPPPSPALPVDRIADLEDADAGLVVKAADDSVELTTIPLSTYATQAELAAATIGHLDDRGNYDASVNTFPASGGSGTAGAVLKGDIWTVSVAGTLGGTAVAVNDTVRALVDTPGQTAGNWAINAAAGGLPAGTTGDVQVNVGGFFGVRTGFTHDGTTLSTPKVATGTGTQAAPSVAVGGVTDTGLYGINNARMFATVGGVAQVGFDSGGAVSQATVLAPGAALAWASATSFATYDLQIYRDAPDTLAQRRGANAQTLRVYNTAASGAEEWLDINWTDTANTATVMPKKSGTGTARSLHLLGPDGTGLRLLASGEIQAASSAVGFLTNATSISLGTSSGAVAYLNGQIRIGSTSLIGFASGDSWTTGIDTAFARNDVGVIEINTGTAGVFGSLKCLTVTTTTSVVTPAITSPGDLTITPNAGAGSVNVVGKAGVAAGTSTAFAKVGGTVFSTVAPVSTTHVDGTEDDLISHSIAANTFSADGKTLIFREMVTLVAHATATRQFKKKVGTTVIFDSGSLTLAGGGDYWITTFLQRKDATTLLARVTVLSNAASAPVAFTPTTVTATLSGAVTVKTTGIAAGVGAAAADIVNVNDLGDYKSEA